MSSSLSGVAGGVHSLHGSVELCRKRWEGKGREGFHFAAVGHFSELKDLKIS